MVSFGLVSIPVKLFSAGESASSVRFNMLEAETGARVTPEEFLTNLAGAYARAEAQFTTYGFAPIREAWLARAAKLGETITARTATSETWGRFETVDETGNLVLETARGRVRIPAADVFF